MPNIEHIKKYKSVHMIGIGGISMSGIAAILKNWGFNVTGSDASDSEAVQLLRSKGIKVVIGHSLEDVAKADVVVYSAAIKQTDPEIVEAHRLKIPTIERADFLGEITRCYNDTICISGTHGKTTTTSMVSLCFLDALTDPSIQVGAMLKPLNGNYRVGNSEHFIIEACEYVESFLKFSPKAEIILDIDNDHLDYFKTIENTKKSFQKYVELLPNKGILVVNIDDLNTSQLLNLRENTITYGIKNQNAMVTARNITFSNLGFPTFDIYIKNEYLDTFTLGVLGTHNVLNALAATSLALQYNIDKDIIKKSLKEFKGVGRRFEYLGKYKGTPIFDDFAHHPTEIESTYQSAKSIPHRSTWAVFQSHTYSRTYEHLEKFADVLAKFDHVIICDIYPARETNIWNVKESDLVDLIKRKNPNVIHIPTYEEIAQYLKEHVVDDDLILTIGAGPVNKVGKLLLEE